ncbi:poly(beta-D-mannuronate) lyase [Rheinheimera pacifica]|uniref:polysaccharide lyase 6 family protein n=1 Tax=Rheinheimera pacifica TaxID=173990 RepID=UPI0028649F6D|nr:polysaccharide lyase 6 family protein [Rheinheimera pacifica]MDR6981545.1 poly(beta-D-mannuronate) lyase [Rheinheimera pacifica]
MLLGWCCLFFATAAEHLVANKAEFDQAVAAARPGDTIMLQNGVWRDVEIIFTGEGTAAAPITLTAQTKGKVILSGQSNLRLAGNYLVVSGLVFKDGYTPSSEVISFHRNKHHLANHSRVTEVVIDNYSNPDRHEIDYWVTLYGKNNRFDHNYLTGKHNKGVTLAVRLDSEQSQQNHHRIDHNYFGHRPPLGSNGGETIRIGTSHYSMSNSHTLIENNYFDRCDGEVEIISVKSGKNTLRNNTFFASRGTLTLRHGNGNLVEDNVFLGEGEPNTGGIRVINRDQLIRNNYMEGLTGSGFGSGFTIMNGVPDSPLNRYHQVVNAQISQNSFINVDNIYLAAGSDAERSAVPIDSSLQANLFFQQNQQSPFTIFDDISGLAFSNNVTNPLAQGEPLQGIQATPLTLQRAANGLLYPTDPALARFGVSAELVPVSKEATGPAWYAKTTAITPFDSGNTLSVAPGENALAKAVAAAQDGAVLELQSGNYPVNSTLNIATTLTIKAAPNARVTLYPARSTLFEIANGGSLKLDRLHINGKSAPDAAGNTLIRTAKFGMLRNYRFIMQHCQIEQLNINHSFHFFDAGNRSFADEITLRHNRFANISGDLFRLDKETDDLGIYNVEYFTIAQNEFSDIGGALAKIYRGGTDESTFGPQVNFRGNKLQNTSLSSRNNQQASLWLHGVQLTDITDNTFDNSAGVIIQETIGEPITRLRANRFTSTPQPQILSAQVPLK